MPNSSDLESIEDDLNDLGLSRESAKVYVALLRTGRSPANALAKVAGIHRVDTYKKLNELTQLGFSKLILGRPTLYEPIDPRTVLESLINENPGQRGQVVPGVGAGRGRWFDRPRRVDCGSGERWRGQPPHCIIAQEVTDQREGTNSPGATRFPNPHSLA